MIFGFVSPKERTIGFINPIDALCWTDSYFTYDSVKIGHDSCFVRRRLGKPGSFSERKGFDVTELSTSKFSVTGDL